MAISHSNLIDIKPFWVVMMKLVIKKGQDFEFVERKIFRPNMQVEATQHIAKCSRCLKRKSAPQVAPLQPILVSQPWNWFIWTISIRAIQREHRECSSDN